MAITYNIKRVKDTYTLFNTGADKFEYTLTLKPCEGYFSSLINGGEVSASSSVVLPVDAKDGSYEVTLITYSGTEVLETVIAPTIFQYKHLISSLVYSLEELVCGCDSGDCDKPDVCDLSLTTLVSALTIFFTDVTKYTSYLSNMSNALSCEINEKLSTYLITEKIKGKGDNTSLIYNTLGLFYASFYLYEMSVAAAEDKMYVQSKYKSAKILGCLNKVGVSVNLAGATALSANSTVYYWQLGVGEDITKVMEEFAPGIFYTKANKPLDTFSAGYTVSYAQVGKIVFAIEAAEGATFKFLDALNNDVTDKFDATYFSGIKRVLYISKLSYSVSNIYFKIKNTTL